jgi:hypothetical protein
MERVFWVDCPTCGGRFYANHADMRRSGVPLMCPTCRTRFLPEEAAALDERSDEDGAAATERVPASASPGT